MYTSDISVDDVIEALANFLTPLVENAEIVRSQTNRVAMPASPCVILTEMLQTDIDTPYIKYQPPVDPIPAKGFAFIHGPSRFDIQIDFYGPLSGEYCQAVKTAFRSEWGFNQFPSNIRPLYTTNGMQTPLTTGEDQYENRWTLTVSLQYNPTITADQDFAEILSLNKLSIADS